MPFKTINVLVSCHLPPNETLWFDFVVCCCCVDEIVERGRVSLTLLPSALKV